MKKIIIFTITFIILSIIVLHAIDNKSEHNNQKILQLKNEMKNCGLSDWEPEISGLDAIDFIPNTGIQEDCTLKFTVKKDDYVTKGSRSELSKHYNDLEGSEAWYSWTFKIPKDYLDVTLSNPDTKISNWQVIGQWHDQPNPDKGENWDNYPGNSPSISINYSYLSSKDPEYDKIINSDEIKKIIGYTEGLDEQSIIGLSYGTPPKTVAISNIQKGKWYKLDFHIKWSQQEDGYIEVLMEGNSITKGKIYGKNMYNDMPHYLKIGLYRNPKIQSTNSIYYKDITYGISGE